MTNNAHRQQWRNPKTAAITHRPRQRTTNSHANLERMNTMHDSIKADLVARLQKLSADERAELMDAAAAENIAEAGKTKAAAALSDLIHPNRKA